MASTELRVAAKQAQPEALRLADEIAAMLPTYVTEPVAAELRRLHAANEALRKTLAASCDEERQQLWEASPGGGCSRALSAEFQRDALLEALVLLVASIENNVGPTFLPLQRARAVIAKAEENT